MRSIILSFGTLDTCSLEYGDLSSFLDEPHFKHALILSQIILKKIQLILILPPQKKMKKDLFVVNRRLGFPTKKDMGILGVRFFFFSYEISSYR